MRIVFINTFDIRGGAAIVANRLAQFLKEQYGAECFFLVAARRREDDSVFMTRSGIERYIERALDILLNKVGLQYVFFPFSTRTILKKIKELNPDIISLHNTHGGYFQTSLLSKISRSAAVVWTLHDMWSFTGNAAHTFGDESWKDLKNSKPLTKIYPAIGMNTGSFLLKQKKYTYAQSNLTIVTPSEWLRQLALKSPVFENKRIVTIRNGVNLNIFKPGDKRQARDTLCIPQSGAVVMFSSEFLRSPWKGGPDLAEVLKRVDARLSDNVHLLIIGEGKLEFLTALSHFTVHQTGYVHDDEMMATYFSASDVFLYPTKADNLPNVLIEAIACATPAVTFNIGGCAEIIVDGYNGIVSEPFDYQAMALSILTLINDKNLRGVMSVNGRKYAEQNFSIGEMAARYHDLFAACAGSHKMAE